MPESQYLKDEIELLNFLREARQYTEGYSDSLRRRLDYMISDREANIAYIESNKQK